ncbi:MAG: hypothetical protein M3075_00400 [Candidatus Dormibacteraeota bacterium]|nr:hypothetical protein [Candidatus Dormibacteraeota bacterium]
MRELGLKAGATALTLAAAVASALYVGGHLKTGGAPMQPPAASPAAAAAGTRLSVTSSVATGDVAPVTSTYVS